MERINIREAYELTRAVQQGVSTEAYRGQEILPLVPQNRRKFKMKYRRMSDPTGIGQFKAPNADTPFATFGLAPFNEDTMYISAVDLAEQYMLEETDILESADALIAADSADEVITNARMLQIRNERLTEKMRWDALANNLKIQFQDGVQIGVDQYGTYAGTHIISSIANPWATVDSSDPGTNLRDFADLIEEDSGMPAAFVWMNRRTFRRMQNSASWAAQINFNSPTRPNAYNVPTLADIQALLDVDLTFVIYNGGYKNNAGARVKWIPDGTLLMHTAPVVDGQNIGETYDCPVTRVVGGAIEVARNPGLLAEVVVDQLREREYVRVKSARMVTLLYPQCFIWANVG
jgi:hypothetical protein